MERKEGQGLSPRKRQQVEVRAEERTAGEAGGKPGKAGCLEVWGAGLGVMQGGGLGVMGWARGVPFITSAWCTRHTHHLFRGLVTTRR